MSIAHGEKAIERSRGERWAVGLDLKKVGRWNDAASPVNLWWRVLHTGLVCGAEGMSSDFLRRKGERVEVYKIRWAGTATAQTAAKHEIC